MLGAGAGGTGTIISREEGEEKSDDGSDEDDDDVDDDGDDEEEQEEEEEEEGEEEAETPVQIHCGVDRRLDDHGANRVRLICLLLANLNQYGQTVGRTVH